MPSGCFFGWLETNSPASRFVALQRAKKSLLVVVWDRIRRYLCSNPDAACGD
jgi:hypothetical protein